MASEAVLPHLDVGSGSPVVLLHGFGLDARMWSAQVAALRARHRVIAPDLPGFGPEGARSGRWSAASAVVDLLETKGLDTVHLVGLSQGGAVATDLVLTWPGRVRSLVFIDALLLGEPAGHLEWNTLVERTRAGDLPAARQAWLGSELFARLALQPEAFERLREMVLAYRCGHWRGSVESIWHQPAPRPLLPRVRCATLVLVGELDRPEFRAMARIYAGAIPGARLVELEGLGHMGPMEAPERINVLLDDFLAAHDASSELLPESPRLEFRTWRAGDLALAMQLWGDARVTSLISRQAFDQAQVEQRLRLEVQLQEEHRIQYWPVFLRTTGELVGCCGLHPHDAANGVLEVGFHLLPRFWGQGLATEAARAAVQHALGTLGVRGVFAGHHPENEASRRVLAKLGFRYSQHELYPPTGLDHPTYLLFPGQFREAAR